MDRDFGLCMVFISNSLVRFKGPTNKVKYVTVKILLHLGSHVDNRLLYNLSYLFRPFHLLLSFGIVQPAF